MEIICKTVLLLALSAMALTDCRRHIVMVRMAVLTALIGAFICLAGNGTSLTEMCAGASVGAALLGVSYITGGKVGAGDGLVFISTGIFLGFWQNMELVMISLWMASFVALFLLIIEKKSRDVKIPFVPFVLAAYVIMLI